MSDEGGDPLLSVSDPTTYWTTTNISEALPGVVTALTWTLWGPRMDVGSRRAYSRLGVLSRDEARPDVPIERRFSAVFYGRPALNVDFIRMVSDRAPGSSGDETEQQLLGSVRPEVQSSATRARLPLIAALLPYGFVKTVRSARRQLDDQRAWWRHATASPPADARSLLSDAGVRLEAALALHSVCSMLALALQDQVATLADQSGRPELTTVLGTGQGEMEEAAFVADVWELSRGRTTLASVLAEHGFQGPGELSEPSFRADPTQLEQVVARYTDRPESEAPAERVRRQVAAREQAERDVLADLPPSRRPPARAILALARRGIPLREVGKACYVMALDVGRAAARARAAELLAAGRLSDQDDVFHLTHDELTGPDRDFRRLAEDRRSAHSRYQGLVLPRAWYGQPEPQEVASPAAAAVSVLEGIPVYAGTVEGLARVATTVGEASTIEPGEVLVCATTDPSWSSAFPLAAGLAIDVGSTGSHGAIVARELGIPCVINTVVGTATFRTGDRIRLDGEAGTVEKIGPEV